MTTDDLVVGSRKLQYADDTQVYISAPATSASTIAQRFVPCVEQVDAWMSSSRLKMNADKTPLIGLGTKQQLDNDRAGSAVGQGQIFTAGV